VKKKNEKRIENEKPKENQQHKKPEKKSEGKPAQLEEAT
jgi:hypothetical protein